VSPTGSRLDVASSPLATLTAAGSVPPERAVVLFSIVIGRDHERRPAAASTLFAAVGGCRLQRQVAR